MVFSDTHPLPAYKIYEWSLSDNANQASSAELKILAIRRFLDRATFKSYDIFRAISLFIGHLRLLLEMEICL